MNTNPDIQTQIKKYNSIFVVIYLFIVIISTCLIVYFFYNRKTEIAFNTTKSIHNLVLYRDLRTVNLILEPLLHDGFSKVSIYDEDNNLLLQLPEKTLDKNQGLKITVPLFAKNQHLGVSSNAHIEFNFEYMTIVILCFGFSFVLFIAMIPIFIHFKKSIFQNYELDLKAKNAEALNLMASQVSHDIRSPLSVLNAIAGTMVDMPEDKRILLRSASNRINDIANQLLQKNKTELTTKPNKDNKISELDKIKQGKSALNIELLSSIVDVMVSEKRMQFREMASVVIEADLEESYGAFAAIDPAEFKRVLSNLINNSIEALKKENGRVVVSVKNYSSKKIVTVRDNGSGIPQHILEKLGDKGITHGKEGTESGSGLGIYHAKKTVESFGGNFIIQSRESLGTEIRMEFPNCEAPNWFVPEIPLNEIQTIVALDDDQSILEVWKQRFSGLNAPVSIVAFTSGNDFNNWIESNQNLAHKTIFLMDYELIGQRFTGLDLIEENKLSDKAILVTSRYEEPQIRKRCEKLGVRLIPKGMAGYVPIEVLRNNA